MKPTTEQIEKYIKAADSQYGSEEWAEWIRNYLRATVLEADLKFSGGGVWYPSTTYTVVSFGCQDA